MLAVTTSVWDFPDFGILESILASYFNEYLLYFICAKDY